MTDKIAEAWRTILTELGYSASDVHLAESPERVARYMRQWHTAASPAPELTVFDNTNPRYDELITTEQIWFYSQCAHHGLPFFGTVAVGYIPGDHILGLSKFTRVVDYFAHRFQVQERMTHQIAEFLDERLRPKGLGVIVRAEHLCMSSRGVQRPGHRTTTSALLGVFRTDAAARSELLHLMS
jgi:GTP cyclohydrolase I